MLEFRLFGARVRISIWFAAAVCASLLLERRTRVWWLVFLLAHELSHIAAAAVCGERVRAIDLCAGRLRLQSVASLRTLRAQLLISASGPAANLLLAGAFALLARPEEYALNLLLAVYNLLPVRSLDGGAILLCLLLRCTRAEKAFCISRWVSCCTVFAITSLGFYILLRFQAPHMLLVGGLLVVGGFSENEYTNRS
ncbi:MAG: hypothetical protein VB092_08390 [Oscillospiraceae bacterium]|nr:hypothetical protein [Oscillospiraceae bacterium]